MPINQEPKPNQTKINAGDISINIRSYKCKQENIQPTNALFFIYIYIYIYIYIVSHRETDSLSHNSSVFLDTRGASSWDQNLTAFTSVGYLTLVVGLSFR